MNAEDRAPFLARNRVPIHLAVVGIVVFGLISLFSLDIDLLPDIEYPELVVVTSYPNAAPSEVKQLVTSPVEQVAASLKGVKSVDSLSREGLSVVKVRYRWGAPLGLSHIELREKMDLLKPFFPREVQRPLIIDQRVSRDPVMGLSVTSESLDPRSLYLLCRRDVVDALEKVEGVAKATLQGGERPEVQVLIDPEGLVKYNVSVSEVRGALQRANKNLGVGFLRDGHYEYLVRVNGEITDHAGLGSVVVKEEGKRLVALRDLAEIRYGAEKSENSLLIDGEKALLISLHKRPSASILRVARGVEEEVSKLDERYGGSLVFQKAFDESLFVSESLRDLVSASLLGVLFTVFSVWIFLLDLRVSLLVILSIPFSVVGTFIVMRGAGISLNLLTLGGFSLSVGIIVDNSVIVATSVFYLPRREREGARFHGAVRESVPVVTSATLTTVVVFVPVLFLTGVLRVIFLQLSAVIVVSLLFSLLFAVTSLPLLLEPALSEGNRGGTRRRRAGLGPKRDAAGCPKSDPGRGETGGGARSSPAGADRRFGGVLERIYGRLLWAALDHKPLSLALLFLVGAAGALTFGAIDKRFLEPVPHDYFFLKTFVRGQVPCEYTERFSRAVAEVLRKDRRVGRIIAEIGSDTREIQRNLEGLYGPNTAVHKVYTTEEGDGVRKLVDSLRGRLSVFPGVDFLFVPADDPLQRMILRSDFEARVKVYHPSADCLEDALRRVSDFLRADAGAQDVMSSSAGPRREKVLLLDREALSLYGVDTLEVSEFLRTALMGQPVGALRRGEHEVPVVLRFREGSHARARDILGYSIRNEAGNPIRLADILELREERAASVVLRENQKAYGKVEFNPRRAKAAGFGGPGGRLRSVPGLAEKARGVLGGSSAWRARERGELERFLAGQGVPFRLEDQSTLLHENYRELFLAFFLAMFLEYAILASGFGSFGRPILVLAMIPLSVPGILLTLFLTGSSLTINTFMGLITLIGLLVNNGIVLFLEYERSGVRDARGLVEASVRRLEPIMITTLSTVLALVPILFTRNSIQINLAATLILGLSYSTVTTLVFLPMLYQMFHVRKRNGAGRPRGRGGKPP